ncbi:hypothetical protein pb186bvf_012927 [Paramecium bursaria]
MIIVILLFELVQGTNVTCQRLINRMVLDYELFGQKKLIQDMMPYLQLSANGVNKWGYYDACLRKNHSYSTAVFTGGGLVMPMGFCHSNQCTTQDLDNQNNVDLIKAAIFIFFNITVDDLKLTLYDPTIPIEYGFGFWVTILILFLFFSVGLFYPISETIKKQMAATKNIQDSQLFQDREDEEIFHSEKQQNKQIQLSIIEELSINESYKTFTNFKIIDPNLAIMDGIRSLAFMMVIFGHIWGSTAGTSFTQEVGLLIQKWIFLNLADMMYSVDIFFWLGGFFIGFVLFEKNKTQKIAEKPEGLTVDNFSQIMQNMAMLYNCPHLGKGPRWQVSSLPAYECHTPFRSLLFIDNFYNDSYCLPWGWYLTNDFQMFLVSLIPLYLYSKVSPFVGKLSIGLLIVITQFLSIYVSIYYNFAVPGVSMLINSQNFMDYYFKSYCRAPPYYIGLLLGIMYREYKQTKKHPNGSYLHKLHAASRNQKKRYFIWAFCYTIGFGIVLSLWLGWRPVQISDKFAAWPMWFQNIWHGICRSVFVIGLSIVVIPSIIGMRDIFILFMSQITFRFMAKISFCGYLLHYIFIIVVIGLYYESPEFSEITLYQSFFGVTAITIIFGSLMTLFIEIPLSKLEKRLLQNKKNQVPQPKPVIRQSPDISAQLSNL